MAILQAWPNCTAAAVTRPESWSLVRALTPPGCGIKEFMWLYYHVATATEPAAYIFRINRGAAAIGLLDFYGVDTSKPIAGVSVSDSEKSSKPYWTWTYRAPDGFAPGSVAVVVTGGANNGDSIQSVSTATVAYHDTAGAGDFNAWYYPLSGTTTSNVLQTTQSMRGWNGAMGFAMTPAVSSPQYSTGAAGPGSVARQPEMAANSKSGETGLLTGALNARSPLYGCFGDGVHDDLRCIQELIYNGCGAVPPAAPANSPHAAIYFPAGSYLHSKPIRITCGDIEIHGAGAVNVGGRTQFRQSYFGPAFIASAYGSNKLDLADAIVGNGYSLHVPANGFTRCSGSSCGQLYLSDVLGPFGPAALGGLAAFDVEFYFRPSGFASGSTNFILGSHTDEPGIGTNGAFSFYTNDGTTLAATLTVNGVTHQLNGGKLTVGKVYDIALDYDGKVIRLFENGVAVAVQPANGTVTQGPWEVIAVPDNLPRNWPDAGDGAVFAWPGDLDAIRFSSVSRHATSYAVAAQKPDSDASTLLLVNFAAASIDGTQSAYSGNVRVPNVFLPIRGSHQGYGIAGITMHDMELGGPLFAIWANGSNWRGLNAEGMGQIPAFDFYSNDYLSKTEDLNVPAIPAGAICFEYGTAYNESTDIHNSCASTNGIVGFVQYGGGTNEVSPFVNDWGTQRIYWLFKQTTSVMSFPFVDAEAANTHLITPIWASDSFMPIIFQGGQIPTTNRAPFVTVQGGKSFVFTGTGFFGTAPEVVHVLKKTSLPAVFLNSVTPERVPLADAPNQAWSNLDGVSTGTPRP